jgi:hypothetical protein
VYYEKAATRNQALGDGEGAGRLFPIFGKSIRMAFQNGTKKPNSAVFLTYSFLMNDDLL